MTPTEQVAQVEDLVADRDRLAGELAQASRVVASLGEIRDYLQGLTDRLAGDLTAAVAHDRQPYPTADAYEKACAALEKHRARADATAAERDRLARQVDTLTRNLNYAHGRLTAAAERDDHAVDQVQAVRDLATEWILTGEVAAKAYGRAVIAMLDGQPE